MDWLGCLVLTLADFIISFFEFWLAGVVTGLC